jgi:2-succinyl-6-hydroxy-2,4-cyclohexadiene-1-carboxylate synthase
MSLLSVQREGSGPSFVWLHGFTQTRASAHQFRSILAGGHELWTLDLPGHGDAGSLRASLDETADLVADVLPSQPATLGGYSFGARVALHVALRHPGRLSALVLLGASRGIEGVAERHQRVLRDESLARHIEEVGVEVFLDEWLDQPMFSSLPDDPRERASRATDNARGLAASLRLAGTGTQAWLAPLLGSINTPTLALAGANDAKFAAEAQAIALNVANGAWDLIRDAGHAVHLEQPQRTADRVGEFLALARQREGRHEHGADQ